MLRVWRADDAAPESVRACLGMLVAVALVAPMNLSAAVGEPVRVEDINPGDASSYVPWIPTSFWIDADPVELGGHWLFHATDGIHGLEPWISDGTEDGTYMILDLCPGANGSFPESGDGTWFAQEFVAYQGNAYFVANDCANHGYELWRTDGTEAGTSMVKDIWPGGFSAIIGGLRVLGDRLYFTAEDGVHGNEVWKSDGTQAGTQRMPFLNPYRLDDYAYLDGYLFFPWDGGSGGDFEIWRSDGTAGGTAEFVDINPSGGSYPQELLVFDGKLFFDADDWGSYGSELWVSDGIAGATLLKDLYPGSYGSFPWGLTIVGDRFFFSCEARLSGSDVGTELCVSDGTGAGTHLVEDIYPGGDWDQSSHPWGFTDVNGMAFFTADDGTHGDELWISDGTAAGTRLVEEIYPGSDWSDPVPSNLTAANGMLFFRADDGVHGLELWRSDGSEAGTFMVADIAPAGSHSTPAWLTEVGGTLFFCAWNSTWGREPFKLEVSRPLYVQLDEGGGSGVISQQFEPAQSEFDCMAADDFSVPLAGAPWDLGLLHVEGFYDSGSGTPPWVNVEILEDASGLPGTTVCSYSGLSAGSEVNENGGDLTIQLPEPCTLGTGDYWLMVQADMDFASGGWWVWSDRSAQAGYTHAWQNPDDGFGYGCTTWAPGNSCHPPSGPDLLFALYGPAGCDTQWLLELAAHDVTGTEAYTACNTIRIADGLTVTPTGRLILDADTVVVEDGLAILGRFEAGRGL